MQPLVRKVGTKETVEINTSTGDVSHYQKIITMEATAYLPTDGDGQCITRMGTRARYGVVAVDPNVIPLGSTVFIPGYGVAGPKIQAEPSSATASTSAWKTTMPA